MSDRNYSFEKINDGTKSVTTAGTAEALVASSTACRMVEIQAMAGNTNNIAVGSSTVVATAGSERGLVLAPSQSVAIRVKDLNDIYIDAVTNGEGVSFAYFND